MGASRAEIALPWIGIQVSARGRDSCSATTWTLPWIYRRCLQGSQSGAFSVEVTVSYSQDRLTPSTAAPRPDRVRSDGRLLPEDARLGTVTPGVAGHDSYARYGSVFDESGLPRASSIVHATDYPKQPCVLCVHFRYDKGQNFLDRHGALQVPREEGGFLVPGTHPINDETTEGGPWDAREIGFCMRSRWARTAALTHRFSTCKDWASKLGLSSLWRRGDGR